MTGALNKDEITKGKITEYDWLVMELECQIANRIGISTVELIHGEGAKEITTAELIHGTAINVIQCRDGAQPARWRECTRIRESKNEMPCGIDWQRKVHLMEFQCRYTNTRSGITMPAQNWCDTIRENENMKLTTANGSNTAEIS